MSWTFAPVPGSPFGAELDGAAWDGGGLLFCDVAKSEILRYDPEAERAALFRHSAVRTRGLAFAPDGRLYGAQSRPRRVVWYRDDGATYYLNAMLDGKRHNDPQHLAIDRRGRIWFSDLWTDESAGGPVGYPPLDHCSVLRLEHAGSWTLSRLTFDTVAPCGVALSADDRTLFVADGGRTPQTAPSLRAYPIRDDGTLGPAAVLRTYAADDRGPAGLCVDASGRVVVAAGSRAGGPGPRIEVIDREGALVATHPLAADLPTSCAFGGASRDLLFVTTGAGDLLRGRAA